MKRTGLTLMTILITVFPMYSQSYNQVAIDTVLSLGSTIVCHSIYTPNDSVIWADFASEIFKSEDRGDSWEKIAVPDAVAWSSLRPLNTDSAFFSAMYSGFYKTTDGGNSWEDMNKAENHPNHFHFFDMNEGMMLDVKLKIPYRITGIGDTMRIWNTSDGGYTWSEVEEPDRPEFLPGEIFYHHANNMNRQTIGDTIFFGTSKGRIFMSKDRGLTWEAFFTGLGEGQFIISVAQHSSKNIMVLSDGKTYGKAFKSSFTNDGGITWQTNELSFGASSIAAIPGRDSSFVLLKGIYDQSKGLFITHDGGTTFRTLLDVPCHTLTFINDSTAIMPSTYSRQQSGGPYKDYIFRLTFSEVPVNIPDTAFLYTLIDEGVDANEDSLISYKEAEAALYLDVSESEIKVLQGIEAFVNLETLDCSNNQLTSLDVTNNTALNELRCDHNFLANLDVTNNAALIELYCDHNLLTNLLVSNNTVFLEIYRYAYVTLNCSNNQLTSLNMIGCAELDYFNCSDNQLNSLNVSTNKALTELDIGGMPSLHEVCVWETFSLDSVEVNTVESPNVCFQTDCNGDCSRVGIEGKSLSGLSIYPNPTNSQLTVESAPPHKYSINITSLKGQLIYSATMEGTSHHIDLSSFQKGIYFITIRSKDTVTTRKIIKM